MPGSIKFLGGVALLVSGLTGPSIAVIPQLFQQAGWFTPLVTFMLVTVLSGSAALLLIEAMASINGNEKFEAMVEYSTLAELFLGHRWHWAFQIILYIALQSQTMTSLIESFQSMDTFLVTVAHKSCAISFQNGWECVSTIPEDGLGVFSDYIFISFGYLITLVLVLPLGLIQLSENIKFQIASFITLIVITIVWVVTFFQVGITTNPIPAVAPSQGTVVGYVISNFAFVTTIPAYVNNIHPSTNIHRVVWLSLVISCVIYIIIGLAGAGAFHTPSNSTILAVISARRPSIIALISVYAFPVAVLVTSIPVFMIVIRYNLLRGNICSTRWAIFWSSNLPWIVVIPFQTNGWLTIIMNWTSLLFASAANLIIPFILYLLSKRYHASAVLDLHQEHDEFQLRPLGSSRLSASASISVHFQPGSPQQRPNEDPLTSPTNFIKKLVLPVDADTEAGTWSDNVIRLIRSPSIHRYYGETVAEGSTVAHVPHNLSISKTARPASAIGVTEDEKTALIAPAPLAMPAQRFSLPGASTAAGDDPASPKQPPTHTIHLSVPDIRINTATIVRRPSREFSRSPTREVEPSSLAASAHTSAHGLHTSMERYRTSPVLPSPREEMGDNPSAPAARDGEDASGGAFPLDSPTGGASLSGLSPFHSAEDDETTRRTFEAFPTLNRMRWFNSTRVAIAFGMLTTTMVTAAVIYNIVLAAHGNH